MFLDMFEKYLKWDLQLDNKKVANDDEIESYF